MAKILPTKSIYYNDVNLINDRVSQVRSRVTDVPRELHRFIVSPMAALVGETFANEAARLGLTVCLHRFCSIEDEVKLYKSIPFKENVYCSIGLNDLARFSELNRAGCDNFVLDIALGFHPDVGKYLMELEKYGVIDKIILGNIHTDRGYDYLRDAANNAGIPHVIVRCGIGNGVACSSSDEVGVNRGQITEIMECDQVKRSMDFLCADGGIHKGGSICKAFAAGADYAMMGGFWMKAKEAESNIIGDGSYWGGASIKQQELIHGKKIRHSEGKVLENFNDPADLKPLEEIVNDLWLSVASSVSYSGYKTLTEAVGNGLFEIKQNSLPPKRR